MTKWIRSRAKLFKFDESMVAHITLYNDDVHEDWYSVYLGEHCLVKMLTLPSAERVLEKLTEFVVDARERLFDSRQFEV